MPIDLALGPNWDLLDENGSLVALSAKDALQQEITIAALTNLGEYYYNELLGIDYLALMAQELSSAELIIQLEATIKNIKGVKDVSIYEAEVRDRKLTLQILATTDFGEILVEI